MSHSEADKFLEPEEIVELGNILARYPGISDSQMRRALLINSCVAGLENHVNTGDISVTNFISLLLAELQQPYHATKEGTPAFIALFTCMEPLMDGRLSKGDNELLNNLKAKCQQWYMKKNPDKAAKLKKWATHRQQVKVPSTSVATSAKMDFQREIVINYDLATLIDEFKKPLDYGKALSFIIAGNSDILRYYVVIRMQHEFEAEMEGEHHFLPPLYLDEEDLQRFSLEDLFEEKIKSCFNCTHPSELITRHSKKHIILTVWNNNLPLNTLQQAAANFWHHFQPTIEKHLSKKKLCFVLLVAHLPPESQVCQVENFITLQLPPFNISGEFIPWISRVMYKAGVPDQDRKYCTDWLNTSPYDSVHSLSHELHRMEYVAGYLQGEYDKGRYDEKKPRSRKRSK